MRKIVLLGLMGTLGLLAFDAKVNKANVILMVNGIEKSYKANEAFKLNNDDIVCFVSGDGRVVITGENYKKQLSKHSKKCKHLHGQNHKKSDYVALAKNGIVGVFGETKENIRSGVSTRGVTMDTYTQDIHVRPDAKYILMEKETWGPLPVTLKVLDEKGRSIIEDINEENDLSSFVIPVSQIKQGYRIVIQNVLEDDLVNAKIIMEN
jgi:hypothetical protein